MQIKRRRRNELGMVLMVIGFASVGLVFGQSSNAIDRHSGQRAWDDYRQALRSASEPLTMEAVLARRPEVSPDHNGAVVLEGLAEEIFALRNAATDGVPLFDRKPGRLERFLTEGLPRSSIEPMRVFLQKHEVLIARIGQLSNYDDGRLSNRWYVFGENPLDDTFDAGYVWASAARLQDLRALSHLVDGASDMAVDAVAVDFAIAATMRHEPTDMALIIRSGVERRAVLLLDASLGAGELDAKRLARLGTLVDRALESAKFEEWIRFNRARVIRVFGQLAAGKLTTRELYSESGAKAIGAISTDEARLLELRAAEAWGELLEVADRPAKLLARAKRIARKYSLAAAIVAGKEGAIGKIPPDKAARLQKVAWALDPFVSIAPPFVANMMEHVALLRCARVALEAEAFRAKNGRLPHSIDELVNRLDKNLLVDPFTRKPLELIRTKTGITIYSVGRDKEDNHGDIRFSTRAYRSPDVGIRLADMQQRHALPIDENR